MAFFIDLYDFSVIAFFDWDKKVSEFMKHLQQKLSYYVQLDSRVILVL